MICIRREVVSGDALAAEQRISTVISSAFWLGKRVFVTGHTTFEGSWLALMLARLNARAAGFASEPRQKPTLFEIARIGEFIDDIRGDLGDLSQLREAMDAVAPDIVIHIADRERDAATNAANARTVLSAARAAKPVRIALIGGVDNCAPGDWRAYDGREMRVFTARAGLTRGGGDFSHITNASALHVMEPLVAYLALIERAMKEAGDPPRDWDFSIRRDKPNMLGWAPLLDARETTAWIDDWRAAFAARKEMVDETLLQVDRYLGQRVRLTSPFVEPAQEERLRKSA